MENNISEMKLKPGRDKSARRFHPWIFTGAVDRITGAPQSGDEVRVVAHNGDFLARGFFSTQGQICCRLCRWEDAPVDAAYLQLKLSRAYRLRRSLFAEAQTDAYRIFNAEGDGIPGLIIDRYGDVLVLQLLHPGVDRFRQQIIEILVQEISPLGIYEKSQGGARREEGLEPRSGVLAGDFNSGAVRIVENGLIYYVDLESGQKTGFYLDQRENRQLVAGVAGGKRVLNGFAYTGAFSVAALAGGASRVVSVESSERALDLARKNMRENGFEVPEQDFIVADMFTYLRRLQEGFELIILDPPSLAKHRRDVQKAARAYKDLNLQAMKKLAPGGMLFTATCSQHLSPDLFQKIIFAAATDARRNLQIIAERGHPADHPISIFHPEGRYLHALLLAAVD